MQNGFLDELVGLFELTGTPDMWEAMYGDLAHHDPAEVAREFGRVEALLQGMEEYGGDRRRVFWRPWLAHLRRSERACGAGALLLRATSTVKPTRAVCSPITP